MHVARLIRPQGRRGEMLAEILTDFPERFAQMRNAFLWRGNHLPVIPILLEQSWLHKGKIVLKFSQVDSISAAEALRGADLVISSAQRMPLHSDEVYISDLIGCECWDVPTVLACSPHLLGTIRDVLRQENTADQLVVAGANGVEYEIPFAKAYVVKVDVAARRLEMSLPPGLLEVNAPLTEEERRARAASSILHSRDE
ncbi:MAG TPA: ribosome maturation factor RimM [Acidobacteriaceae bacterium]|nr:ribosome maturation factor RimM [Acidobacteriaceae bacterium]